MLLDTADAAEGVESAIVSRENAVHRAFAASRTDDFVYAASHRYLGVLHNYCDGDFACAPLVVVSPPGLGKSALLAHWVRERRQMENACRECIIEHYSGCSYDSIKLSLFLFRLMTQIKAFFGLRDFEIPQEHQEEKLKFSLARCLDAAVARPASTEVFSSKLKRMIIVLDSVDCIRTEDGGDSLSWLPTSFPREVKIVLSTSLASVALRPSIACVRKQCLSDDEVELDDDTPLPRQDYESHTIRELRRRNARFLVIEPLDEAACRAILTAHESAAHDASHPDEANAIFNSALSSSPLCVRLVLQGLTLFNDNQTRSLRHLWLAQVLNTNNIPALYALLMRRWNEVLLEGVKDELCRLQSIMNVSVTPSQDNRLNARRRSNAAMTLSLTTDGTGFANVEALQAIIGQRALLVRHTLSLLSVARYGLSESDIVRLVGESIPRSAIRQLLRLLGPHLMRMSRFDCADNAEALTLYSLSHNQLRMLIRHAYLRDEEKRVCYYREIASYFNGLEACQRRVDELPVQLERCHQWNSLQGILVDIAMFQLWWSPHNRQQLYAFWNVLRQNGALRDPVDDLMRSLEEHVVRINPNAEQLLRLLLSITDFLRAWQSIDGADKSSQSGALHRPDPPQLPQFLTSVGCSSTAHLTEALAQQVQGEIDALSIHVDDGYSVRRWLWTQFPLVGIAFESRFLRQLLAAKISGTGSSSGATSNATAATNTTGGSNATSPMPATQATSTSQQHVAPGAISSPSILNARGLGVPSEPSPMRGPRKLLEPNSNAPDDFGAFEFLSANQAELPLGSVSKLEARLMALHTHHDRLLFACSERQRMLDGILSRLATARASAHAAGESAGQIETLQEQIRAVADETQVGRQRSDYYKAILRHCEINPARDPNVIDAAEAAVHKMQRDVRAVQQQAQVISFETRLATTELHNMTQVVEERAAIHQTALDRLRWRKELLDRLRRTPRLWDSTGSETSGVAPEDYDLENSEDDGGTSAPSKLVNDNNSHEEEGSLQSIVGAEGCASFARAKDRLVHKKETMLARLRKGESLQIYVGSPFKDDGILGALRQVGLNRPEEAQRFWQDQVTHAAQLEMEERTAEQAVLDAREHCEHLQAQFVNLKLGGGSTAADEREQIASHEDDGRISGASTNLRGSSVLTRDASINAKGFDKKQQLAEASVATQAKKERVTRVKTLSEKLRLGLLHVAQILGVTAATTMDALELADAVEQVVRLYLGDEGHLQTANTSNLRRKNSVRASGLASQNGLSAYVDTDMRSLEDRIRFNIRVTTSPHRQVNPYASASLSSRQDAASDCDDTDINDTGDRSESAVARRSDIKNLARLEVEKRLPGLAKRTGGKKSEASIAIPAPE